MNIETNESTTMKINILSPGRCHVCDLARELDKCGYDVRFYSMVPTQRTSKFGLPQKCNKSLIIFLAPFLLCIKLFPKNRGFQILLMLVQDYITAFYMRKCDVVIAMSGNYVYSLKKAKKYGAVVILERGSKHILEQKRILETIPSLKGQKPVPDIHVKRELAGYELANYISIASEHVKESFLEHNFPKEKLFVNSYGTSLNQFYATNKLSEYAYDVIMTGAWSYQKGCDLIIEAIRRLNIRFLHVGRLVDLGFPKEKNFTHIDSVQQVRLIDYYKQAKIFVLPSRQEGLAMVLSQAIVCGLPIVCSKDTGGCDLRSFLEDKKWIIEMQETNAESLVRCIKEALILADLQPEGKRDYAGNAIKQLTWEAYGKRYDEFLTKIG